MANLFVGSGSAGNGSGSSWANRLGSLSAAELKVTAGSTVYVAPGTYRETLTCGSSGSLIYDVGIVNVINQSAIVTGVTTAFSGVANTNCIFWITKLSSGTDGSAVSGSPILNANLGNFLVGHIGHTIRINTIGAFIINVVNSASQIGVMNPDLTSPFALFISASGLTYDIGPEQPFEIQSVDSNTQLTLKQPWSGPTLNGLPYVIYNPIRYIGDVTGAMTDGVGGVVRVTGAAANDQSASLTNCIADTSKHYRSFQGFTFDTTTGRPLTFTTANYISVTDCSIMSPPGQTLFYISGGCLSWFISRCYLRCSSVGYGINLVHTSVVDNTAILITNSIFDGGNMTIMIQKIGGIIMRNCTFTTTADGNGTIVNYQALTVGQCITVNNTIISGVHVGVQATVLLGNELAENYNDFWANLIARTKVETGSNSLAYPPLFNQPIQYSGLLYPNSSPFALSPQSPIRAITGFDEPNDDFYGMMRPVTSSKKSWGAIQYQPVSRSSVQAHGGTYSLCLSDAGRTQMIVPTTNVATTFSVYVYREAGYTGVLPQMVLKQPYQTDVTIVDTGAVAGWNLLATTIIPAALPTYTVVEMVSNNTAGSGSYNVYFDDLTVN